MLYSSPDFQQIKQGGRTFVGEVNSPCRIILNQYRLLMELVRQCHERIRSRSSHVVTIVKIEDEEGVTDKLSQNIKSVEQKAGRQLSSSVSEREGEVEAPVSQSARQEERVRSARRQ